MTNRTVKTFTPSPQSESEKLRLRGVKTRRVNQRVLNFLGKNANTTFATLVGDALLQIGTTPDFARVGQVFESGIYQRTPGSSERTYEAVYEGSDYTAALSADPSLQESLDQVFGDTNVSAAEALLTEATILASVGSRQIVPNEASLVERQENLIDSQNGTPVARDEDTPGITGVDDVNSPIFPFR